MKNVFTKEEVKAIVDYDSNLQDLKDMAADIARNFESKVLYNEPISLWDIVDQFKDIAYKIQSAVAIREHIADNHYNKTL